MAKLKILSEKAPLQALAGESCSGSVLGGSGEYFPIWFVEMALAPDR